MKKFSFKKLIKKMINDGLIAILFVLFLITVGLCTSLATDLVITSYMING